MSSPRYQLEKHPKPKGRCPNCGEKKVFRYFCDAEGNRLNEEFGICDRAAKCGYDHRPSGELFTATGEAAEKPTLTIIRPTEQEAGRLLGMVLNHTSHLHQWALAQGIPAEHLDRWAVATDRDRTAFLHLNAAHQLVNAKWFKYTAEGKRDKLSQPYSFGGLTDEQKKTTKYGFCLYGEHLLRTDDPERPICVVESEKTAVLAAHFYPDFDWLACGAANGVSDEKISALFNRPVWWMADADGNVPKLQDGQPMMRNGKPVMTEGGRRNSSLRNLKSYKLRHAVVDLFPERTDGYDLADALRDGQRPDVAAAGAAAMLAAYPPAPAKAAPAELPEDVQQWSVQRREQFQKSQDFVAEFLRREIILSTNAEDWENVVNALAIFQEHGRELVHQLARPGKTYSKADTDAQFDAAVEVGICTSPAKFFQIAKHYRITLSEKKDRESAQQAVKETLPPGVSAEDYFQHGFYELDNCYYSIKDGTPRMVCGFTIKVLYLVKSKSNPKRIVELKNQFGYTTTLDLPTDAFTGLGAFKKCVEGAGNFVFEGNEVDLTRLKKKLFREEKTTTEITTLGWQERGQFYAFSNGIFNAKWTGADEYGIVEHDEKNYFLPFRSSINLDDDAEYVNEKKFQHRPGELKFDRWAELMTQVYAANGIIGISYYIASLYRDIVFEHLNAFPLLFCFGQRQSGKTKFTDSLKPLFGQPQDSLSLENPSSTIGLIRSLANFSNAIIMLDEYKNSVDKKTVGLLKGLWDGFGRVTGVKSNDNQTKVTKPKSAVIVSGQDMPTIDNALFTRTILLEFLDQGRNYHAYDTLKRLEKGSLTSITLQLLGYRALLTEHFRTVYHLAVDALKQAVEGEGIEDRMIQNMASIIAPTQFLMENADLVFPFTVEELYRVALTIIRRQHQQISHSTDSRRFWDVFVGMASAKPTPQITEGQDYKFVGELLCIRLGNVHPPYLKEHRSQFNVPGQDKQTIDYYLKHDPAFVGLKNMRFDLPKDSPMLKTSPTSAYCFNFKKLGIDLQSMLGPETAEAE